MRVLSNLPVLLMSQCVWLLDSVESFGLVGNHHQRPRQSTLRVTHDSKCGKITDEKGEEVNEGLLGRRTLLHTGAVLLSGSILMGGEGLDFSPPAAQAAVGTLPEFDDTNAIIQGVTVKVADAAQQKDMINFLVEAFDFKVLRKRIRGTVEETVGLIFISR